jgi:hypothetical protein
LQARNAWLVITTTRDIVIRALRDREVTWSPPDPVDLVKNILGELFSSLSEENLNRLCSIAVTYRKPGLIVPLAESVRSRPDAATQVLDDAERSGRDVVDNWLKRAPETEDLLTVAAVAFVDKQPLRILRRLQKPLLENFAVDTGRGGRSGEGQPAEQRFTAIRRRPDLAADLLTVRRLDPEGGSSVEAMLTFVDPAHRGFAIDLLWEQYDLDLWEPLREWLCALTPVEAASIRIELARGIALLARTAPQEVFGWYLHPWSVGEVAEQWTTVYILWAFCEHEDLAPLALQQATAWSRSRDLRHQHIAIQTFTGLTGLLYTGEALNALGSFYFRHDPGLVKAAREGTLDLFAGARDVPASGASVLRFTLSRLRRAHSRRTSERERWIFLADLTLDLLIVTISGSKRPVVTSLIATSPEALAAAGQLWAMLLVNSRWRREAAVSMDAALHALSASPHASTVLQRLAEHLDEAIPLERQEDIAGVLSRVFQRRQNRRESTEPSSSAEFLAIYLKRRSEG